MKTTIKSLTSLRFFAAALIVLHHSADRFHIGESFAQTYLLGQGVGFFFVLSGFILTYTYDHISGARDYFSFVWARFARVWPAHILMMLVFHAYWTVTEPWYAPTLTQALTSATLTQAWGWDPAIYYAFNSVAWTLSVEMFFYLLFPFFLTGLSKTWLVKLYIAASFTALSLLLAGAANPQIFAGSAQVYFAYVFPPAYLLSFVFGMIGGMVFKQRGTWGMHPLLASIAGVVGVALIIYGSVVMPKLGPLLISYGMAMSETAQNWLAMSGSAPFYALALFLIASGGGLVSWALSWRPLVLLGEISFSIYLTHQVIIRIMRPQWFEGWPMTLQMGAYWIATLCSSYMLWRFVEKPCQRFMRSMFKSGISRKSRQAPAVLADA